MTERLRTTLMITAILVASAFVTATTWAGLRIVTSGATMQQQSARITSPGPTVHARLLPARPGLPAQIKLLPLYRPAHRH